MRRMIAAVGAAMLATTAAQAAPVGHAHTHGAVATRAAVTAALADPARADQADDDARRQAAAVLAFSGVGPGDLVVDYMPGSGYWTRLFSPIVGAQGHVYSLWPSWGAKYAEKGIPALQAKGLANDTATLLPDDAITVPQPVDLVWTVQNYHDINNQNGPASLATFNASVFRALKPGGTYVIIDHVAAAGSGIADTGTLHRIDPAVVKREVEAAGFRFVGASTVLANPADTHQLKVFDPAIRGHTDQFVFKFRKPA